MGNVRTSQDYKGRCCNRRLVSGAVCGGAVPGLLGYELPQRTNDSLLSKGMKHIIPINWKEGIGQVALQLGDAYKGGQTMVRIEIKGGRRHTRWAYIPIDALMDFVSHEIRPFLRYQKKRRQ